MSKKYEIWQAIMEDKSSQTGLRREGQHSIEEEADVIFAVAQMEARTSASNDRYWPGRAIGQPAPCASPGQGR